LVAIKEQLIPSQETLKEIDEAKNYKRQPLLFGQIDPNYIISLTWSLLLTEDPSNYSPLALRLVQELLQVNRFAPFSNTEIIMLYQIDLAI